MKCKMVRKKSEHQKLLDEWRLSTNLELQSRLKARWQSSFNNKKCIWSFFPLQTCFLLNLTNFTFLCGKRAIWKKLVTFVKSAAPEKSTEITIAKNLANLSYKKVSRPLTETQHGFTYSAQSEVKFRALAICLNESVERYLSKVLECREL